MNHVIIIPTLNPTIKLVSFVKLLLEKCASNVIIVNDGSNNECRVIFETLSGLDNCDVITMDKKCGKGIALKTAFLYYLEHYSEMDGVVTVQDDAKYSINDIKKVIDVLNRKEEKLVLGIRNLLDDTNSFYSKYGIRITNIIFKFLYGSDIKDTLTSLRGIPTNILRDMLHLKGDSSEYEMNMLVHATKQKIIIEQVPTNTVLDKMYQSSYRLNFTDYFRIILKLMSGFFHYLVSFGLSGLIDIVCFVLLYHFVFDDLSLQANIFISALLSRTLSSICNFIMNRNVVFSNSNHLVQSLIKYYILWFGLLVSSSFFVYGISAYLPVNVAILKVIIDLLLGIASYQIQLLWVFKNKKDKFKLHQ